MHKPTPSPKTCTLESASLQGMQISREKRALVHSRGRFSLSDRKVPAAYFPLFRNEPAKTPRKTASHLRRVESTCISKKLNRWKMRIAQNTRRNSSLGRECLESDQNRRLAKSIRYCIGPEASRFLKSLLATVNEHKT